jgi:hypothetical protein
MASVAAFCLGAGNLAAQERPGRGGGDFDPEQFRQRIMERYREQLEVKSDDEWKIIEGRIQKVMDARREVGMGLGGRGGFGGFGRRGGDGGGGGRGGDDQGGGRRGGRGGAFDATPSPEVEALQKALDAKASPEELKAKLAKVREARKTKEAALATAQDELRKVLSVRQEATSVMMGLLQ